MLLLMGITKHGTSWKTLHTYILLETRVEGLQKDYKWIMNRRKIVRKYLQELLTADFPSQQQRDYKVYIVDKRD